MEQSDKSFYHLGIAPGLLEILERMKITVPTPIQHKAIPPAIEGKDVVGIAQSGTGKTIAFGIPMMQRLAQGKGLGLILAPTRELAIQVGEILKSLGRASGMEVAIIIGGAPIFKQLRQLKRNPRILVATPGRLIDHLERRKRLLDNVRIVVLDEADRMLDMGFKPQINRIMQSVPQDRQTMLFSATMPSEIVNIAKSYMKLPVNVEIAPSGTAAETVVQELFIVKSTEKSQLLSKLLAQYRGTVLLFARTRAGTKKLRRKVGVMGYSAAEIHSDRSLGQRREALEGFKSGKYRVLVATDVAARGIDVTGIELVINYDLPDDAESYVHRIGRTGRAGKEGHAISFAMPDQLQGVRSIERLIRSTLPISKHPDVPAMEFVNRGYRGNKKGTSSSRFGRNKKYSSGTGSSGSSRFRRPGGSHRPKPGGRPEGGSSRFRRPGGSHRPKPAGRTESGYRPDRGKRYSRDTERPGNYQPSRRGAPGRPNSENRSEVSKQGADSGKRRFWEKVAKRRSGPGHNPSGTRRKTRNKLYGFTKKK